MNIKLQSVMALIKKATVSVSLMALSTAVLAANGKDPFAGTKEELNVALGSGSELHFAMLAIGLAVAAVTGAVTKNWVAAIGTFVVLVIFLNVAGGFIGLS